MMIIQDLISFFSSFSPAASLCLYGTVGDGIDDRSAIEPFRKPCLQGGMRKVARDQSIDGEKGRREWGKRKGQ